jgi:hypothetical protein
MKYLLITAQGMLMAAALQGSNVESIRYRGGARVMAFDVTGKIEQFKAYTMARCVEKQQELRDLNREIGVLHEKPGVESVNLALENTQKADRIVREIRGFEHAIELLDRSSS